ncbi:hypothetical protein Tsubulata_017269 [Turnera subulata]|uniref:Uncharacterized protein n=1 Tax=Turnera subulata TaxID=218843 RepID=A0A9Q0GEN5_9ROSI|nr:hypothetical protein Tsubulata_017269 [Turnera subulata]
MGPDSKLGNEVMAGGGGSGLVSDSKDDVVMQCVSNCEDRRFDAQNPHDHGAAADSPAGMDVEVDILECTKSLDNGQGEAPPCDDETESMSSFGDTDPEIENDSSEVESQFHVSGAPPSIFDGYGAGFGMRKKKLTDHWRRFIRPLMWRCKWLELQIKEFQSQALKYDRELALHRQRKQLDCETFMVDDFIAKSLPLPSCLQKNKVMKRKKRKRFEDTADIASYVLQHNLFSYYENKKSGADGVLMIDGANNPDKMVNGNVDFGLQNGFVPPESTSSNSIHEGVFRKIEVLQSHVRRLKAQIDRVMIENPMNFSILSDMSLLAEGDALTSDQSPLLPENGDGALLKSPNILPVLKSECNMGDIKPENAVPSHEKVAEINLVHGDASKDETPHVQNSGSRLLEKLELQTEKQSIQASEPILAADMPVAHPRYSGKSLPKPRLNVTTKSRRRGRRKSGSGRWSRRTSGVPSAQMATFALGALHQQFVDRKINTPEDFHSAILDIFKTPLFSAFNSALPGKHYDVPSGNEIKTLYKAWKEAPESEKREVFINFMKKKVQPNKLDEATMITGIVTPPAAMAAKRAGESLPQLKILKMIPDVIFVPSATILALISSKVTKRMLKANVRS